MTSLYWLANEGIWTEFQAALGSHPVCHVQIPHQDRGRVGMVQRNLGGGFSISIRRPGRVLLWAHDQQTSFDVGTEKAGVTRLQQLLLWTTSAIISMVCALLQCRMRLLLEKGLKF